MDLNTIQTLRELNNGFYRLHHASFSATRENAWPGWERVVGHLEPGRLLDVACGNLRFERFLEERAGAGAFAFTCLDSCGALAEDRECVTFIERDVVGDLVEGCALPGGFDAAVSFGFLHHVPSEDLRVELLRQLVASVRVGGLVAVSFWQFMRDARLAEKARATTEKGCAELGLALEEGDYLLGWNDEPKAYRYCHAFEDDEIDALAQAVAADATVVDRFRADGRTGELNGYLVFRRL